MASKSEIISQPRDCSSGGRCDVVVWTEGESEWPSVAKTFREVSEVNEVTPETERKHSKCPQGYK